MTKKVVQCVTKSKKRRIVVKENTKWLTVFFLQKIFIFNV